MKSILALTLFICLSRAQAHWGLDEFQRKSAIDTFSFISRLSDDALYQIGSVWGKEIVTYDKILQGTPAYQQAALQTFKVYYKKYTFMGYAPRGTSFYLGQFNGEHVFATNYHVGVDGDSGKPICANSFVEGPFIQQGLRLPCKESLGYWPEVDLALFTVQVTAESEPLLTNLGHNFAFHKPIYAGQELITTGFGVGFNKPLNMVSNYDVDCVVFSPEVRFMADPDNVNPGNYSVWSFANGCDISHGDSGSAMIDRRTGDVVGIIWTGSIPKSANVKNPDYLKQIYQAQSEDIWQNLSYAAPATHIYPILLQTANQPETPASHKAIFAELLR